MRVSNLRHCAERFLELLHKRVDDSLGGFDLHVTTLCRLDWMALVGSA